MRLKLVVRTVQTLLKERGAREALRFGRRRIDMRWRASRILRADAAVRLRQVERLLNGRLEFDELHLTALDVSGCEPGVLKDFLLEYYDEAHRTWRERVDQLDQLALLIVCDMLFRRWRFGDLTAIAPVVRQRCRRPNLRSRVDNMLRRAAIQSGALSEAERGLAPIRSGSFSDLLLRGDVWNAAGRMDLATPAYEQALLMQADNPMARLHYGFHLMKKGDLAQGLVCWGLAERLFGHYPLRLPSALWRGEPLDDRHLTVVFEHGFGDMIQFARYLVPLLQRFPSARITGCVPAPIVSLLAGSFPQVTFTSRRDGDCDFHVPVTQLPLLLGAPFHEPRRYIAGSRAGGAVRRSAGGRLRVGVCWRGHPRQYEQTRSIDLATFASLFSTEGVTFTVLLNKLTPAEQAILAGHPAVEIPAIADFRALADVIDGCDCVLTVDTATTHLAGAMGKPVLLLSRPDACWRWGAAGSTSPWYDDVEVIRHPFDLDWANVLTQAKSSIDARAARLRGEHRPEQCHTLAASHGA